MEDSAGASRGASLPIPSSQASTVRKEWRVVSEHSSRSAGDEVVVSSDFRFLLYLCCIACFSVQLRPYGVLGFSQ